MNNGWIKLHRKVQDNELWKDQNAWRVFQWILMNVDYQTGKGTFGRKQMAQGTGLKENTVYKVTTRLQTKYQVLSKQSNNHFTEISVINWAKYQSGSNEVTTTVTETQQVASMKSNTIKELKNIKNKEIEEEEKIPNRLIISRSQLLAYLKEYPGITSEEIKTQREECNRYMAISSENYTNPGLFFRKWLAKYWKEQLKLKALHAEETRQREEQEFYFSAEQIQANKIRLAQIKGEVVET